jgi:hypothetical protein
MCTEKDKEEFIQWLKDNGKMNYELTDVYVNNDGEIKLEKKMAWVAKTCSEDWRKFCKITGREYNGEINLLAIY